MSNATNELLHALHKCVILYFRFGSFGYCKTQKFHLTKGRFLIFLSYERSGHGEISHKVFFQTFNFVWEFFRCCSTNFRCFRIQ